MRHFFSFVLFLVLVSCSTLIQEPCEPDNPIAQTDRLPLTRSSLQPENEVDATSVRHYYQTDHRIILIRHVELRDRVYVQTLTEDDMTKLNITEEERAFGVTYLTNLNKLINDLRYETNNHL